MIRLPYQQIDNHGRSGMGVRSFVAAGCRGYRPAGHPDRQDFAERFLPSLCDASLLTGRGLTRSGPFPIQTAVGRCIGYRRRRVSLSLPCWPVANSWSAISGSSTLSFDAFDHSPCRDTDLPHRHSSTSSLSHEHDPRARHQACGSPNSGIPIP